MYFLQDPKIPLAVKLYSVAVILAGIPVLAWSLRQSLIEFSSSWFVLIVLCLLAGLFPIRLPSKLGAASSLTVTLSDVFIFTGLLLLGPEKAVTIAVLDGVVGNLRTKVNRAYKKLFNLGALSLATMAAGRCFYFLLQRDAPLDPESPPDALVLGAALAVSAALFCTLNSGTVALAIALSTREPLRKIWRANFGWSSLPTIAGASVAALVFLTAGKIWLYGVVFGVPIVLVIYNSYRINLQRLTEAERHASVVGRLYDSAIASLATAIDAKDQCTHGHLERVQVLALSLARLSGLDDERELEALRAASLLHDVGKIAIPEHILNKPAGLTQWETRKMRTHPNVGADILSSVPFPYPVVPIVRSHHERWDGSGYPQGLRGEEIPLGARILAIADCYDALRSDRPYRGQLSVQAAADYIVSQSGKAYDPKLVEIFAQNTRELEAEMAKVIQPTPRTATEAEGPYLHSDPGLARLAKPRLLFHDTAGKQLEIEGLREMSSAFGRAFGLDETLSILSRKLRQLVPCEALAIYMLDSVQGTFVPQRVEGEYHKSIEELRIGWGKGVTGWVAANRQPLLNVDPRPEFSARDVLEAAFNACLSVPLLEGEMVLGVITLYSSRGRHYSEDDLRLMETFAHFSVSVITNALIHEQAPPERFTDEVTGLPDLRHFRLFAQTELKRSRNADYPVSLVLLEMDDLNRLAPGENLRVLAQVAHLLRRQIRKTDVCSRKLEGFRILLPGLGRDLLQPTLTRIKQALDEHRFPLVAGDPVRLGFSVGFATSPRDGGDLDSLETVARRALVRDRERRRHVRESAAVIPFDKRELGR